MVDLEDETSPQTASETWIGTDLRGASIDAGKVALAADDRFYYYESGLEGLSGAMGERGLEADSLGAGACRTIDRVGDAVVAYGYDLATSAKAGACYDVTEGGGVPQTATYGDWTSKWQAHEGTLVFGGKKVLKVLDVSDPANPDSLGSLVLGGSARAGDASGTLVAVEVSDDIWLIDVSDPSTPVEVGHVLPAVAGHYISYLALEGDLLVVEEHDASPLFYLAFHDVSDPANPRLISTMAWTGPGRIAGLVLEDSRLYALASDTQLRVYDVRDPSAPAALASYPEVGQSGRVRAVAVDGNQVQVVGAGGVQGLRFLDVAVELEPDDSPVEVSPGDAFSFQAQVENLSLEAQSTQVWLDAVLPNGSVYGPIFGPYRLNLGPLERIEQPLVQPVPAIAPLGRYQYRIRSGAFPGQVADQATFDFSVVEAAASPPDSVWGGTYGDGYRGNLFNVHATADGGFVVVGSVDRYERDIWLARLDAQGRTLWNQYYGNLGGENKADDGYDVQETADGGFLVGGSLYRVSGLHDAVMIRTDLEGVEQRRDVLASYASEKYSGITAMSDGRYVGAGDYGKAPELALLAYYTEAGVRQEMASIQCLEVPGGASVNDFRDVLGLPDGGLVAVGSAAGGTHKGWVVRTDAALNVIWENLFEIPTGVLTSVVATPDGGFAAAGYGFGSMVLVRMDADGNVLWEEYYEAGSAAEDLVALEDGFVLASTENDDAFLLRTDEDGLEVWTASYGGPSLDHLYTMDPAPGGGLVCGGRTRPEGFSGNYPWLFRLSAEK